MEFVEMNKIKTKEKIEIPNKPELLYNKLAIKVNLNGEFVLTNENDTSWYNYDNKKWALAIESSELDTNGEVKNNPEIFAWIPRFAVNDGETDIKYIFSNGKRYLDSNGNLNEITSEKIPSNFTNNDKELKGRWARIDNKGLQDLSMFENSDLINIIQNMEE